MSAIDPRLDLMAAMPVPTETPQPPWLMSFADFVSCLLACFVLLYSLVAVDRSKLDKILEGVPGRQAAATVAPVAEKRAMEVPPQQDGRNTDYLATLLRAKLERDPALAHVQVEGQGDRVLLHLSARDLLSVDSAGATQGGATQGATTQGGKAIFALGGALGSLPNRLAVEVRPDRPGEFAAGLGYAVKLALRLEQAGANGPIVPRARLTTPGEAAGIDLIVFDTAPASQAP
jgi:hypothetical protein